MRPLEIRRAGFTVIVRDWAIVRHLYTDCLDIYAAEITDGQTSRDLTDAELERLEGCDAFFKAAWKEYLQRG